MISKIYNNNQILFEAGSRKGRLREEIQLNIEMKKDKPDKIYIQELKRAIAWKKPKKKKLNKAQRRAKFLKSPKRQSKNLNKSRKVMINKSQDIKELKKFDIDLNFGQKREKYIDKLFSGNTKGAV